MFLELERRGYQMGYVRTPQGFEVDFLANSPGETAASGLGVRGRAGSTDL